MPAKDSNVPASPEEHPDQTVRALLDALGYPSLYPPQKLALENGILEGRSMLVTTPTASGKTLIAMMAIMKAVERGAKAVYLTPLRALANEKYADLKILERMEGTGGEGKGGEKEKKNKRGRIKVMVATGDYDSSGRSLAQADVIVLTNEKMDTLFRHGAEWLGEIGLFISDEVHLIGDRERGPTLEMMLAKIRKVYPQAQIVALSATVANSDEIAEWLGCDLVESSWRPTRLVEGVYDYGKVRMSDGRILKVESSGLPSAATAVDIAIGSLDDGGQALIFAETRRRAASLAAKAAEWVYVRLDRQVRERAFKASAEILERGDDTELTSTLAQAVAKGVAFHHAGLSPSSREIVEESFKNGTIRLLTATPTLAAGVNLPARRVVIASVLRYDSDYGGNVPISVLEYKQLCGRAGRPRYDDFGEAIIAAAAGESGAINADEIYDHYVLGSPEPIRSQMSSDRAIRFHLLSAIAMQPGMKKKDIFDLFSATLFARQYRDATVTFKVESALGYLEQEQLVRSKNDRFIATEFGKRTSLLYIDPLTAVEFKNAIERTERRGKAAVAARRSRKVEDSVDGGDGADGNDDAGDHDDDTDNSTIQESRGGGASKKHTLGFLHLIASSPDFFPKLALRKKDYEEMSLLLQGRESEMLYPASEYDSSRSFWALAEWIEETSDRTLGDRMGVEPGDMYRIVEISSWLAYSLYEVAKLLRRDDLLAELAELRTRIKYGVKEELLPLVALEGIGRVRARALYSAGFSDADKVARAPVAKLASVPKIGPAVAEKLRDQLMKKGTVQ